MMHKVFSIPELFQQISKFLKVKDLVNISGLNNEFRHLINKSQFQEDVDLIKRMSRNTCNSHLKQVLNYKREFECHTWNFRAFYEKPTEIHCGEPELSPSPCQKFNEFLLNRPAIEKFDNYTPSNVIKKSYIDWETEFREDGVIEWLCFAAKGFHYPKIEFLNSMNRWEDREIYWTASNWLHTAFKNFVKMHWCLIHQCVIDEEFRRFKLLLSLFDNWHLGNMFDPMYEECIACFGKDNLGRVQTTFGYVESNFNYSSPFRKYFRRIKALRNVDSGWDYDHGHYGWDWMNDV